MTKAVRIFVLTYPPFLIAAFFCTWFAARLSLGHWPRPYLDDPKHISGLFALPFVATRMLFTVGSPLFVVGVALLLYQAVRDVSRRKQLLTTAALAVFFIIVAQIIFRWDPWRIGDWFMD